eukprot:3499828-Pyramimonas_sp.AAC.1
MALSGAAAAGAGTPGGAMRVGAGRTVGRQAGAGSPLAAEVCGDRTLSLAFAFGPVPALAHGRAPICRRAIARRGISVGRTRCMHIRRHRFCRQIISILLWRGPGFWRVRVRFAVHS